MLRTEAALSPSAMTDCLRRFRRLAAVCAIAAAGAGSLRAQPTQVYSHGDPTASEQYVLELINRARKNPPAEGQFATTQTDAKIVQAYNFFATHLPPFLNLTAVRVDFNGYAAQPPLAFNAKLIDAARFAANDQATHNYQGHVSSDGSTLVTRAERAGYADFMGLGENTYATVTSPLFGHIGFNVDWGVPDLGHRINIMNLNLPVVYKEVGIAYVAVTNSTFKNAFPNVLTQNFGITFTDGSTPFLVGVCYRDADGDNFYTEGEGSAGIKVTPDVGTFFAVTSTSGGYTIPLKGLPPGTTSINVTFSGGPLTSPIVRNVPLDAARNIKADLQVPATAPVSRLVNLSTRLRIETGDNVGIAGFVVSGTGSKRVLVRCLGPSLAAFGVTGPISDPMLVLNNSQGQLVASNDNWRSTQATEIQAARLAPGDDREAALIATLPPGAYTAIVSGAGGAVGVGIVEAYDLDSGTPTSNAINLSTRGKVQTGENVMIGGFVISGNAPKRVVVRVLGPSLAAFGVTGTLQDPTLELNGPNGLVASNDNWKSTQQADLVALNLAPTDDRESAIVATLPPGAYTAVVRGAASTIGVAIVEVYDRP